MKRAAIFMLSLVALPLNAAWAQNGIAPADAAAHAGGTATIEGVAHIYTSKSGMIFIDMGGNGKNSAFSGVIFATSAGLFSHIADADGKTVAVTGAVQIYQGKPEIIINSPSQVAVK